MSVSQCRWWRVTLIYMVRLPLLLVLEMSLYRALPLRFTFYSMSAICIEPLCTSRGSFLGWVWKRFSAGIWLISSGFQPANVKSCYHKLHPDGKDAKKDLNCLHTSGLFSPTALHRLFYWPPYCIILHCSRCVLCIWYQVVFLVRLAWWSSWYDICFQRPNCSFRLRCSASFIGVYQWICVWLQSLLRPLRYSV